MERSALLGPRAQIRALQIIAITTGSALLDGPGYVSSLPSSSPGRLFAPGAGAQPLFSLSRGPRILGTLSWLAAGLFSLPSYRWGGESVRTGAFGPSSHCDGFSSPVASQPLAGPGGVTIPAGAPWSPVPPMFLHLLSLAAFLLVRPPLAAELLLPSLCHLGLLFLPSCPLVLLKFCSTLALPHRYPPALGR